MGIYRGDRLARRGDVVYVSLNYRLGALGYLDFTEFSTPERPIDANLGLRDQVAALQWIQRNIAAFGGDPDNVTLFGESAGGTSVTTLLATPRRGACSPARSPRVPRPSWWATPLARGRGPGSSCRLLGCDDPADATRALDAATPAELGKAAGRLGAKVLAGNTGLHPFGPVVDGDFLPVAPLQAFTDGTAHPVPLIIGTNAREGTLFPKVMDGLPTDAAPHRRDVRPHRSRRPRSCGRRVPRLSGVAAAIDLGGDLTFWKPSVDIADAHSAHAPTYSYRFDYAPRLLHRLGLGATHAFEVVRGVRLRRVRGRSALTAYGGRRGLRTVTDRVQENWISFARGGVPEPWWPRYDARTGAP